MNIKKRTKIIKKEIKVRKLWTRSPITQITPNRKRKDRKQTTRELLNEE